MISWITPIVCVLLVIIFYILLTVLPAKKNLKFNLKEWQYGLALVCLTAAFSIIRIHNGHDWGGDFSCYIAQAKSILAGTMSEQVNANNFIVSNSSFQYGPAAYPWGYPLMLAPVIRTFGINFVAIKGLNVVLLIVTVFVFFKFMSKKVSHELAFCSSIIAFLGSTYLELTNQAVSDIFYVLFSIISVVAIERFYKSENNRTRNSIIASLTCFGAFFVRTIGIVSFLTVLFIDIVLMIGNKNKFLKKFINKFEFTDIKLIEHIIFYVVFFALYLITKLVFPSGETGYAGYFSNMTIKNMLHNSLEYIKALSFSLSMGKGFSLVLFIFVMIFAGIGVYRTFFKRIHIVVFCMGVLAITFIFPEYQGLRYLVAVVPWIFLFSFSTIDSLKDFCINNKKRFLKIVYTLSVSLIAAATCMNFYSSSVYLAKRFIIPETVETNEAYTEDATEMYNYIMQNTSEEDLIEFFKPRVLWLNTGRMSISVDKNNAEKFEDIDYVLTSDSTSNYIADKIDNSDNITPIHQCGMFTLYKINK